MFSVLYYNVFNEDGTVKSCGRDKCKDLIRYCQNNYPDISFGNLETGIMKVENIRKIYQEFCESNNVC